MSQIRDLLKKYDEKIKPRCPHFNECGGCMFQDQKYENQLDLKRRLFINKLKKFEKNIKNKENRDNYYKFWKDCEFILEPSKEIYEYRNKIEMVALDGSIGFRKRGKYDHVIDIDNCEIFHKKTFEKFKKIKKLISEFPYYDMEKHNGFVRYVNLKKAHLSGEDMITFVTNGYLEDFHKVINKAEKLFASVSWLSNTTYSDVATGEEIYKSKNIKEKIDDCYFYISPKSFFQSNSYVTKDAYEDIRNFSYGKVLDLFGGSSTIGNFVAKNPKVNEVTTVDILDENINLAIENIELNKSEKVKAMLEDAKVYFKNNHSFDTIILDPPRTGLGKKNVKLLLKQNFKRLIYMSCNPITFLEDVKFMFELETKKHFELKFFKIYDMFPQTPHFETIAVIDLK